MDLKELKNNLPKSPGCYLFKDKTGKIIYIGKAANLKDRVSSYWRKSNGHTPAKEAMVKLAADVSWIETDNEIEALLLESNLIKKHQPYYNVLMRDDKRYLYVKISIDDKVPGVFTTRQIDRSGRYFGPFTGAMPVKETLKAIRKIWPYCTERKVKNKLCFYAQVGRCFGPCGGEIDLKEYNEKVIKPIIMFFEGKKKTIINKMRKEILNLKLEIRKSDEGSERYEDLKMEISVKERQLKNIDYILEHTRVISIGEKYAADVVELSKILGLPKVPARIEGYDISNIFGQEAVGSMVVFSDGEPDKSEYRKFKIKVGQGEANDVGMMREVMERRLSHSISNSQFPISEQQISNIQYLDNKDDDKKSDGKPHPTSPWEGEEHRNPPPFQGGAGGGLPAFGKNLDKRKQTRDNSKLDWPSPDLIILDGGKGQLNAVASLLKKNKIDIPVIAVSKGNGLRSAAAPDKIFFPGEKKPLQLPAASPALHIIKRVRDEAHRFAVKYHRELRNKKMFGR
jgi:excinuclease ABC subunit C